MSTKAISKPVFQEVDGTGIPALMVLFYDKSIEIGRKPSEISAAD